MSDKTTPNQDTATEWDEYAADYTESSYAGGRRVESDESEEEKLDRMMLAEYKEYKKEKAAEYRERYENLADTESIREFMQAFGQHVKSLPSADVPDDVRRLRGALVLEEAFELVEALGLKVSIDGRRKPRAVDPKKVRVEVDTKKEVDFVETADALADLIVVVKGGALAFGIPVDKLVLEEVSPSNMSKLGEDGKPIYREGDNKVLKGPDYFTPDIRRGLKNAGWDENA